MSDDISDQTNPRRRTGSWTGLGQLHELAALVRYAADRVSMIKTDVDGEVELRKIGVALINLSRQVEDVRANAHARRSQGSC